MEAKEVVYGSFEVKKNLEIKNPDATEENPSVYNVNNLLKELLTGANFNKNAFTRGFQFVYWSILGGAEGYENNGRSSLAFTFLGEVQNDTSLWPQAIIDGIEYPVRSSDHPDTYLNIDIGMDEEKRCLDLSSNKNELIYIEIVDGLGTMKITRLFCEDESKREPAPWIDETRLVSVIGQIDDDFLPHLYTADLGISHRANDSGDNPHKVVLNDVLTFSDTNEVKSSTSDHLSGPLFQFSTMGPDLGAVCLKLKSYSQTSPALECEGFIQIKRSYSGLPPHLMMQDDDNIMHRVTIINAGTEEAPNYVFNIE